MDYKLLLDTAVMAGEILLESGAETWRVEDTMLRMLRMSGLKTADSTGADDRLCGNARRPGDGFHDCYAQRREPCNGSEPDPCGQSAFPRSAKEISTWMRCSTGCGISIVPSRN